ERAYLKRDVANLAANLTQEQSIRIQLEANKEFLEEDIDILTRSLFEQVNAMVFDQATSQELLEIKNRELGGQLEPILTRYGAMDERLKAIKGLLVDLDSAKKRCATAAQTMANGNTLSGIKRCSLLNSQSSQRSSRSFGMSSSFVESYYESQGG